MADTWRDRHPTLTAWLQREEDVVEGVSTGASDVPDGGVWLEEPATGAAPWCPCRGRHSWLCRGPGAACADPVMPMVWSAMRGHRAQGDCPACRTS